MPLPTKLQSEVDTTPEALKPFLFHGLDLNYRPGDADASGQCPFCNNETKFSVKLADSQWHCWDCELGGNATIFIRKLWEISDEATNDYSELATNRGLVNPDSLMRWGVCRSIITQEWLIPGYGINGALNQLYKYVKTNGRMLLMPTPRDKSDANSKNMLGHQLHGVTDLFDAKKNTIWLMEGIFDAVAWWEILSMSKKGDGELAPTSSVNLSLLSDANVLAVPGCKVFFDSWMPLFAGKTVNLMFDSDHPRANEKTGKTLESAGYRGMETIAGILANAEKPPKQINYLCWGPDGYNMELPNGYDVRDKLNSAGNDLVKRRAAANAILNMVRPVPDSWVSATKGEHPTNSSGSELECVPCTSYKTLINSWRKALRWTDGLDCALSVMLASIVSTKSVGDQLWVKIISPASCLHGDTPIFDPVDMTTMTVEKRCDAERAFSVYSLRSDGRIGIMRAEPPKKFPSVPMYKVYFRSGGMLLVTGGHRFWNGSEYLPLYTIRDTMSRHGSPYALPSVSCDDIELVSEICQTDAIVRVEGIGLLPYYDFHVPETENYWACGYFHHNSGKSVLCEALSVSKKFVLAKSTLRGFHSGYGVEGEDNSLISIVNGKTLITKDGDTLLQSPNLAQILSEARDVYDTVSRSSYRIMNKSKDYLGIRMTWILCGTASLRAIDSSELGERFLDCVIMDGIDDDLENEILWRVANRAERNLNIEADGEAVSRQEPEMTTVMQLSGGYVEYLRENAFNLFSQIQMSDEAKMQCARLGKFVAYMRARPSKHQDEKSEREFAARLVSQHIRLAKCLAVVLNYTDVDGEVMRRTIKVAMDTSRGNSLEVTKELYSAGKEGMELKTIYSKVHCTEDKTRSLMRFMRQIGIVEHFTTTTAEVVSRPKWRLTEKIHKLYAEVVNSNQEKS